MNIKFSIIMITYNHEKFISKAIESVLQQTYNNFELFIVNDGSTDNSDSVIKEYNDKRIFYKYQENKGLNNLANSYNETLEKCTGDYICILEGDDYWCENKLEVQLNNLDTDADIIWSKSYYVNTNNIIIGKSNTSIKTHIGKLQDIINEGFLYGNLITPSPTIVFKKNSLMKVGGFSNLTNVKVVDYNTALTVLINNGVYQFIDDYLGYYRRHENQATQLHRSAIYKEHNLILLKIFSKYSNQINIYELNNALAWNDILEKYSDGYNWYIYKYFSYLFTFNRKHKIKYLFLLTFGYFGKNKLYAFREKIRGIF